MTASQGGGISPLTVPRWGMAMEEGTLLNWLRNEGDVVNAGEDVLEMESSKIVNVLQAHHAGVLRRKLAAEGDTLPVGALVGVISPPDVPDTDIDAFIASFRSSATVVGRTASAPASAPANPASTSAVQPARPGTKADIPASLRDGADDSALPASPHARRRARELGVNLHNVRGSGRGGRIQIEDIERAIVDAGGTLPGPDGQADDAPFEEIPFAGMRRTIARRLRAAKQEAPHYRLVAEAAAGPLLALREQLNRTRTQARISVNDLLIKACAAALMEVPDCNIQFDGQVIRRFRHADIAVAVALPEGLITPIVKGADLKSVQQISSEMRELTSRARAGALRAAEYEGGTFTISNLGMFGIRQFDAVINTPQAAILAVGASEPRVVASAGAPAVQERMTLTLSLDHRVIDGAVGARFMKALVRRIQEPAALAAEVKA